MFRVLAAALLCCCDGARAKVVCLRRKGNGAMNVQKEGSVMEPLEIAIDVPFVRFVRDLMPRARRDLVFCAE